MMGPFVGIGMVLIAFVLVVFVPDWIGFWK